MTISWLSTFETMISDFESDLEVLDEALTHALRYYRQETGNDFNTVVTAIESTYIPNLTEEVEAVALYLMEKGKLAADANSIFEAFYRWSRHFEEAGMLSDLEVYGGKLLEVKTAILAGGYTYNDLHRSYLEQCIDVVEMADTYSKSAKRFVLFVLDLVSEFSGVNI